MKSSNTMPNVLPAKSYVDYLQGHGIQGLILTLNLAQCQKLKDLFMQGVVILNSPEDNLDAPLLLQNAKDYIVELMPLLENFEIFESPNDVNLF